MATVSLERLMRRRRKNPNFWLLILALMLFYGIAMLTLAHTN